MLASVALGVGAFYALPAGVNPASRALLGWNAAAIVYFLLALILHANATHESIRASAKRLDEGRAIILLLTIAATIASIGAIVVHLNAVKSTVGVEKALGVGLTIITVLNSWLLLHLSFAFHYAHEYYTEEALAPYVPLQARGGLRFPGTKQPQYVDFLYFSYVIGVACQTADVETCSPTMRAIALVHGVIAFFFNSIIVALMVNIGSQLV